MKTRLIAATLFSLATAAVAHAAEQPIRPGLWQLYTSTPGKTEMVNPMIDYVARMRKEMKTMTPEAREATELMLADLAVRGSEYTADGYRTKVCITREDIANIDRLIVKDGDSCSRTRSPIANGEMTVDVKCTRRPVSTSRAIFKFPTDKAVNFESTTTLNDAMGKPLTYHYAGWAKWLGNNCGQVLPASAYD